MTNSFPRSIEFKIVDALLEWPKSDEAEGVVRVTVQGGKLVEKIGFDMPVPLQDAVEELLRQHLADQDQPTPAPVSEARTGSVPTGPRHTGPGGGLGVLGSGGSAQGGPPR